MNLVSLRIYLQKNTIAIMLRITLIIKAAIIKKTPFEQKSQCFPPDVYITHTTIATIQLKGYKAPIIDVSKVETRDSGRTILLKMMITRKIAEAMMNGKGTRFVDESWLGTTAAVVVLSFFMLQTWLIFSYPSGQEV